MSTSEMDENAHEQPGKPCLLLNDNQLALIVQYWQQQRPQDKHVRHRVLWALVNATREEQLAEANAAVDYWTDGDGFGGEPKNLGRLDADLRKLRRALTNTAAK